MDTSVDKEEDNQKLIRKRIKTWHIGAIVLIALFILPPFLKKQSNVETTKRTTEQNIPTKTTEQKQKEEEEIVKKEEEKKTDLATQYCSERKQSKRYYPIPKIKEGENGEKEYELDKNLMKMGVNLTNVDCKNIIDYLYFFNNKYAVALSIDYQSVVERKYWIGMNVFELWSSMGFPDKINKTNYGSGVTEQYVYYKDSYRASAYYIYVEGNKVTSYQDF